MSVRFTGTVSLVCVYISLLGISLYVIYLEGSDVYSDEKIGKKVICVQMTGDAKMMSLGGYLYSTACLKSG